MNGTVFDYNDVEPLVEQFCAELPRLFGRHAVTADLVSSVDGLSQAAETPFTVAVVGQMRVGKSTLINALLGKDLAVTGVNETTATVNWFHYGHETDTFRVHWKDRPSESFPISDIDRWIGDSAMAAQTRCLEFYDDAEFLRVASLVDTPGLRSVIESHEEATNSFLGMGHDADSRRLGSRADAVIYVLMPVARESDEALLTAFENKTRLPGSSAYNSLAVLHKWETLDSDDPLREARSKAQKVAQSLRGSVSEVLPVSGPLAKAAASFDLDFWRLLARLACESEQSALDRCLISDRKFKREIDGCALTPEERAELLQAGLPWPSLKTAVRLARRGQLTDPEALRLAIADAAQMDHLRQELDRRFFSRSRTLKLLSVVSKGWGPCQLAQVRLRERHNQVTATLVRSEQLLELLADRVAHGDADLVEVITYIGENRSALEREQQAIANTLHQLSELSAPVRSAYEDFNADLRCLESLESCGDLVEPEMHHLLAGLFGARGPAVEDRLAAVLRSGDSPLECIDIAIHSVRKRAATQTGGFRSLCSHAVHRLEQLADQLELSEAAQAG